MKNITISIDDETYRRARLWAAERGTSVSAIVKCILTTLPARSQGKPGPPPPYTPESHAAGIQAAAEPVVLIPGWGLSVLRTTLSHFPPGPISSGKAQNAAQGSPVLTRETVKPAPPAAE